MGTITVSAPNPASDLALAEIVKQEVLQPIRELHDAFKDHYRGREDAFAAGVLHVLRDLRELIFTAEELES